MGFFDILAIVATFASSVAGWVALKGADRSRQLEDRVHDLELRRGEREDQEERKANVRASYSRSPNGQAWIRIRNWGPATAENVDLEFLEQDERRRPQLFNEDRIPVARLIAGQEVMLEVFETAGWGFPIHCALTWIDGCGPRRMPEELVD